MTWLKYNKLKNEYFHNNVWSYFIYPADSPCFPNPCENRGTCSVDGASYTCTCLEGFTGDNCETQGMLQRIYFFFSFWNIEFFEFSFLQFICFSLSVFCPIWEFFNDVSGCPVSQWGSFKSNLNLCSALMNIEQWAFHSGLLSLWHWTSAYIVFCTRTWHPKLLLSIWL